MGFRFHVQEFGLHSEDKEGPLIMLKEGNNVMKSA